MRTAEALALGLGGSALAVGLVALLKQTTISTTTSFAFDTNLVPTEPDSFALGSSLKGVSGLWVGAQPDLLTVNSVSDRLEVGGDTYVTNNDLTSYTSLQFLANQSFTSQNFIASQSFTSVQYVANQSFSTATQAFNPSFGAFYSTENQYMGLVTVSANISSKSSLFYNFSTVKSNDILCSVTRASSGGNSVSGDSRVYVMTSGVYKISTSIQFDQTANSVTPVAVWLAVNGTPVPDTGSIVTIQQASGETVPFVEFLQPLTATQFFEIQWNSFNTTSWAARFSTADNLGSTSAVNVPSVITNVYRIA
jgi:hypothetical protein